MSQKPKKPTNRAMDLRCERWGEWRKGARSLPPNVLARLRQGTVASTGADRALIPHLDLEAWETDRAIKALPAAVQKFLRAVYPRTAATARELGIGEEALVTRLNQAHRDVRKALDQRKRGEPMNVKARRPRLRVERGSHAAVQVDG
jgi:hypothetical protein